MKKLYLIPVVAAALFITAVYLWSQNSVIHDFTGECDKCHLTLPKEGDKNMIFTSDINFLCAECHQEGQGLSHPVGMKPSQSMNIPSTYPLDWKDTVTCITCHTAHKSKTNNIAYLLRTNLTGELFCRECHTLSIEEGVDLHRGTIDVAHAASGKYTVKDSGILIDALSMKCLVCHDASLAKDAFVETGAGIGRGGFMHGTNVGLSHPIGVDYAGAEPTFVPLESLRSEIQLFDGKVGCGSCHNPYAKRHFQLVMSNEYSALCFACHIK